MVTTIGHDSSLVSSLATMHSTLRYPMRLFWLIKSPPLVSCKHRQEVARQLLGAKPTQLEPTTRKIRHMCEDEIRHCHHTGKFDKDVRSESGPFLFCLLKSLAAMFPCDTQVIEGMNSVVKLIGRRCPSITLELLSGRLVVKRFLSGASDDQSVRCYRKFSEIKSFAEGAVKNLAQFNTSALSILADANRWATADPTDFEHAVVCETSKLSMVDLDMLVELRFPEFQQESAGPSDQHRDDSTSDLRSEVPPEALTWAKKYNIIWKRAAAPNKRQRKKLDPANVVPHTSMVVAVVRCRRCEWPEFFLVVESFAHSVQFARLQSFTERGGRRVKWQRDPPPRPVESTMLFLDFWWLCSKNNVTIDVDMTQLDRFMINAIFGKGISMSDLLIKARSVMKMTIEEPARKPRVRPRKEFPGALEDMSESDIESDGSNPDSVGSHRPKGHGGFLKSKDQIEDISGESGTDSSSSSKLSDSDDDVADLSATKIKAAKDGGRCPSDTQVLQVAAELQAQGGGVPVPEAEIQEEALLLLLQKSKQDKLELGRKTGAAAAKKFAKCAAEKGAKTTNLTETSPGGMTDSDGDDSDGISENLPTLLRHAGGGHNDLISKFQQHSDPTMGFVLCKWLTSFVKTLLAMEKFALTKDIELGHERSIAFVQQKPVDRPVSGCQCLRCKCKDESSDLIFVHWLNNTRPAWVVGESLLCVPVCVCASKTVVGPAGS